MNGPDSGNDLQVPRESIAGPPVDPRRVARGLPTVPASVIPFGG